MQHDYKSNPASVTARACGGCTTKEEPPVPIKKSKNCIILVRKANNSIVFCSFAEELSINLERFLYASTN